jgi:hypothetical protein
MLKKIKKQVDLQHMLKAIKSTVRQGFSLSCFFVIGFPDETIHTLRETTGLIRRLAILGVDEVSIAKFVPYPGSEMFRRLQAEGKVHLDDSFFIKPMYMFSGKSSVYCDAVSPRRLYWAVVWMYVNFFAISFVCRPLRPLRIIMKALVTGREESRYAKWLLDRLFARRRWRRIATETAAPGATK